jgi:hydroxymethylglutaryl-CoA reductase
MKNSSYAGFYKLSMEERLNFVKDFSELDEAAVAAIKEPDALNTNIADHMIENVIGTYALPMGVALNFKINDKDYVIPMVTEEASVVAAASNAARLARPSGGFYTSEAGSIMIAQVQLTEIKDVEYTKTIIIEHKKEILKRCNDQDPVLVKLGGGALDLEVRTVSSDIIGDFLVIHLKVNTLDAMGANAVNTMAEAIAPYIEEITGGKVYLRILSNLAVGRLVRARVKISKEDLGGEGVVDNIIKAYAFAKADPYRAATHNKGIMNGISAVVLATGNDTRAIESGAHAYAAISGRYTSLTAWEKDANGDLKGSIELPLALGLVGGATKIHPTAQAAIKILGVKTAKELSEVVAVVGLAQNFAAVRALATDGIQKGHMALHAKNVAITAGATDDEVDKIVKQMIADKKINVEYAKELLKK